MNNSPSPISRLSSAGVTVATFERSIINVRLRGVEPGDEATTPPDLQTYTLCTTGNLRKPFQVVTGLTSCVVLIPTYPCTSRWQTGLRLMTAGQTLSSHVVDVPAGRPPPPRLLGLPLLATPIGHGRALGRSYRGSTPPPGRHWSHPYQSDDWADRDGQKNKNKMDPAEKYHRPHGLH